MASRIVIGDIGSLKWRGTVVAEDTGEYVIAGRKARLKDSDAESTTSKASGFSGARAFEHYLLCLQLVLRKQLRWLIETKKLPEELETLVRDLWALRLQRLRNRVSYDSETETDTQSHHFSSQSDGETSASEAKHDRQRPRTKIDGTPNLMDTIALSYMGALLLRKPLTIADLHHWINEGDLPFYHGSKNVPLSMRERLPAEYQELLEPNVLSKLERRGMQSHILEVISSFSTEFGMALPPINHPLILYRWVQKMALPVEVFAATLSLARMLDMTFAYGRDAAKSSRNGPLRFPEPRLMALLITATKLVFPIDGVERSSAKPSDMDALKMHWLAWAEMQALDAEGGERRSPKYEEALEFSQADVLGASEVQLDQYMDWCEHNIVSEEVRERGRHGRDAEFRRVLFRMFPAHADGAVQTEVEGEQTAKDDITETLRQVQSALRTKGKAEDRSGEQSGIGSFYRRIKEAGSLEGPLKLFYERGAELSGLSLNGMVKATARIDVKLERQEESKRKAGED
ncbi:hypothetical protein LTR97_005416 [Elasticomyces elasticus]|uniref:Uncharacterized protein n=1 Tax=Elasticomyces elasticus TaxID=574655 RepID=A0AAN7W865_9PEZI|nr:hypothetical protein LTR97_005416 [Elasticomyces elasticus]